MKIVIVGGGTAGWISALLLKKETNNDVSVIDSSSIGPLGVGESTTGLFSHIIRTYFSEKEFVRECGVTPKLGTEFIGWNKNDFYSPLEGTFSNRENFDYALYYGLENNNLKLFSKFTLLADNGKTNFHKNTTSEKFIYDENNAYHLDTYKTISYLKKKCIDIGVNFFDSKVVNYRKNELGNIDSIYTEDEIVECDFIVDCSGFNRVLVSTYDPKFVSYEKWMSVNTGLPFNLSWKDVNYKKPVTTSRALSCGWMWAIPTRHSIGCGIVYDDNFCTQEEIIEEVNQILGDEITIRKEIKFKSGRLENSLYYNVASIGTAYSFLEPLQATSIHTTILQIEQLIALLKNNITSNQYNEFCATTVDNYADFVSLHYQFNYIKNDFWKSRIPRDYTAEMIEKSKTKLLEISDYGIGENQNNLVGHVLWGHVLAGGNLLFKQKINYTSEQLEYINTWKNQISNTLSQSMSFNNFINLYHD